MIPLTALYFVREAGLSPVQVGLGLSLAGVAALLISPSAGPLLNRCGALHVLIGCYIASAFAYAAFPLARSFGPFVIVVAVALGAERITQPARLALTRTLSGEPAQSVDVLAAVATVRNVGFGLGGLMASVVLGINTRAGYIAVALANTASYLVASGVLASIRPQARTKRTRTEAGYRSLWRDEKRYYSLAVLNSTLVLYDSVLVVGIPLWLVRDTSAPPAAAGVLFTVNTVIVVLAQTRVSTGASSAHGTAVAYGRVGLACVCACALLALAGSAAVILALMVLFFGVVALTVGELNATAAEWGASVVLTPEEQRSHLLGVFGVGSAAASACGPGLVAFAVIDGRYLGWAALALNFLVAGQGARWLTSRIYARDGRATGSQCPSPGDGASEAS